VLVAGCAGAEAWEGLGPVVAGSVDNVTGQGPLAALTGPVARGDTATLRRHIERLSRDDALLYRALGRAALELAREQGMDETTALAVADALATDPPPVLRQGART